MGGKKESVEKKYEQIRITISNKKRHNAYVLKAKIYIYAACYTINNINFKR